VALQFPLIFWQDLQINLNLWISLMKTRMSSLSGDSLLQSIRDHFQLVKDYRNPAMIRIALSDFLMSGFAIFSLKFSSLLQFEEKMREEGYASQLSPLYKMIDVPSDTHMRSVLDEINPEEITPIFKAILNKVQESKRLEDFQFIDKKYLISFDGTQNFSSNNVHCDSCLVRKTSGEKEELNYYHQTLGACIVHPDKDCVIPLCPEPLQKQDGMDKNDCERAAFRRFLARFRKDHPKLPVIFTNDALHTTAPMIRDLKIHGIDYISAVKPGSHETLFVGIEKWAERGKIQCHNVEEEFGDKIKKKRVHAFRYANKILLNFSNLDMSVNFFEYWETTTWVDPKGRSQEVKRHFSWITSFEINDKNIMQLMRGGRARWKIENETFNTLKNQGYEFEHNFGHGYKNLSVVFSFLMFLAFLFDQVQQLGCKVFKELLKKKKRKKYLWEHLRFKFMSLYDLENKFESWIKFLEYCIGPPKRVAPS
jgi:hypothetical protein